MMMEELNGKINKTKVILYDYVCKLVGFRQYSLETMKAVILKELTEVFSEIVTSYGREELREYAGDQSYWLLQLQKVSDAFDSEDRFLIMDTLWYETRENMEFYQKILVEKGLVQENG